MPLEPMYSLDVACELIPITRTALEHILNRNKDEFPLRYYSGAEERRRNGRVVDYEGGNPIRMLLESECLRIRERLLRPGRKGFKAAPYPTIPHGTRKLLGLQIVR